MPGDVIPPGTDSGPPGDQAGLFRRLASGYDEAIRRYQPAYDAMLALSTDLVRVAAPGRARCLDFGAGPGAAIPLLASLFDEVVAIEPGRAMLDLARARVDAEAPGSSTARVSLIEGTMHAREAKALAAGSFDAVHCSLVLMFVKEDPAKREVLDFFHRLLRPSGVVVITELVASADVGVEARTFNLWKELMRHRGGDDDLVAAAERQVYATMDRRRPDQLRSLLEQTGFGGIVQPFQVLHTVMLLATKQGGLDPPDDQRASRPGAHRPRRA